LWLTQMFRKTLQNLRVILHQTKDDVARITKPTSERSSFMAMVENDLWMTLIADFATQRLGSYLA
jgi:hypothetical protein